MTAYQLSDYIDALEKYIKIVEIENAKAVAELIAAENQKNNK
jgi:hypothetical protein